MSFWDFGSDDLRLEIQCIDYAWVVTSSCFMLDLLVRHSGVLFIGLHRFASPCPSVHWISGWLDVLFVSLW